MSFLVFILFRLLCFLNLIFAESQSLQTCGEVKITPITETLLAGSPEYEGQYHRSFQFVTVHYITTSEAEQVILIHVPNVFHSS